MKHLAIILVLFFVVVCSQSLISAGPPGPPPPPSVNAPCWPPPCIPIDGGISALIVAGAAYGAKKLYDKKKKDSNLA
jgi:hypothetical protein